MARGTDPVVTRRGLPGNLAGTQSRYIEAAVSGVLIGCLYAPNGNPQSGPNFAHKLAWFERLITHAAALHGIRHRNGAIMGDMSDLTIPAAEHDAGPSRESSQPKPTIEETGEAWFLVPLGAVALIEIVALAAWLGW